MFGYSGLEELPILPKYKMDENRQIVIEDLIEEKTEPEREDSQTTDNKEE